ncbi:MAG: hypothetical protein NTY46_00475 [Candidatus Sumerlaeota bacterium]|nr:hypothetical protein [Candidatus Sumerlaeota bacterium]
MIKRHGETITSSFQSRLRLPVKLHRGIFCSTSHPGISNSILTILFLLSVAVVTPTLRAALPVTAPSSLTNRHAETAPGNCCPYDQHASCHMVRTLHLPLLTPFMSGCMIIFNEGCALPEHADHSDGSGKKNAGFPVAPNSCDFQHYTNSNQNVSKTPAHFIDITPPPLLTAHAAHMIFNDDAPIHTP